MRPRSRRCRKHSSNNCRDSIAVWKILEKCKKDGELHPPITCRWISLPRRFHFFQRLQSSPDALPSSTLAATASHSSNLDPSSIHTSKLSLSRDDIQTEYICTRTRCTNAVSEKDSNI